MNLKVSTGKVSEDEGIVYVLLIKLEDKDLVKIGVSGRTKVEDRIVEILLGIFKKYRYFPYVYAKRFRKTVGMFEKETMLHRYFADYKYKTEHSFGGSTEFFDIPLDIVVEAYEKVLGGETLDGKYEGPDEECKNSPGDDGRSGGEVLPVEGVLPEERMERVSDTDSTNKEITS